MEKLMENETLCRKCGKIVKYRVECGEKSVYLYRHKVHYNCEKAFCVECGAEVWAEPVDDYNVDAMKDAYRRDKRIITPDEIGSIIDKYGVEPEYLSRILGWEDDTVAGYMNGAIPSKSHSDKLYGIMNNEASFYRLVRADEKRTLISSCKKAVAIIERQGVKKPTMPGYIVSGLDYVVLSSATMEKIRTAIEENYTDAQVSNHKEVKISYSSDPDKGKRSFHDENRKEGEEGAPNEPTVEDECFFLPKGREGVLIRL